MKKQALAMLLAAGAIGGCATSSLPRTAVIVNPVIDSNHTTACYGQQANAGTPPGKIRLFTIDRAGTGFLIMQSTSAGHAKKTATT